jgi:hypothetical protein
MELISNKQILLSVFIVEFHITSLSSFCYTLNLMASHFTHFIF